MIKRLACLVLTFELNMLTKHDMNIKIICIRILSINYILNFDIRFSNAVM